MTVEALEKTTRAQMLADAAREAAMARHVPVVGRGDAEARIGEAFARTPGWEDAHDARAVLVSLGVAYGEGDKVTCHDAPLIVPEAPALWAACQKCGNRYGLSALAGLRPSTATKGEGK